jgi:hypothetical protein
MDCVELKLKQELNDLCSRLNIDLPFLVSSISIEEFFDNLEKFLGIKQQADAVACWIDEKEHCVYGYYDSDDLFVRQLVYVGIGRSARANSHWAGTHALDFQVFIDELKAFGFQQSDVFEYLVEGLNQRQAAAVETLIIDEIQPKFNKLRYWTPDLSHEITDEARYAMSEKHKDKQLEDKTRLKIGSANSNKVTLELLHKKHHVRFFQNTSQNNIARWIKRNYDLDLNPTTLWSTIKRNTHHRDFQLKIVAGNLNTPDVLSKLKRRVSGTPVIIKETSGKLRLFVSANSAADTLNVPSVIIYRLCNGEDDTSMGLAARELTDDEFLTNITNWPLYYVIEVDGEILHTTNLRQASRQLGLRETTLTLLLRKKHPYSISNGIKLRGEMVFNSFNEEVKNFCVDDNLKLPEPAQKPNGFWNEDQNILQELHDLQPTSIADWGRKSIASYSNAKKRRVVDSIFRKFCDEANRPFKKQTGWDYQAAFQALANIEPTPSKLSDWSKGHQNSYHWAVRNKIQKKLFADFLATKMQRKEL